MIELQSILILWETFRSIFKKCFRHECVSLEDIVKNSESEGAHIVWHDLSDWENLEDLEIFEKLKNLNEFNGEVYVVTEASYKDGLGPFKLNSINLELFVENHLNLIGECFFNGDVLIVDPENLCMWVFHHEGVFAFISRV
ncbi:hypothetical protein [Marinibactrum halimedae]|uniref:Uncharacterized protein n=1 Tax=Marinibactrum halimedae TaxID=1444977 RepID=A0AA37T547_9GAMM|nr:hypothetical protein [Marinibactrum halimedae]MCD9461284.1 hypothetical protein [Marinibactrum halimedae]GLS25726.1 hypothetical protein GCM10007877_14400 [Marinibactrum halimedae]